MYLNLKNIGAADFQVNRFVIRFNFDHPHFIAAS